MEQQVIFKDLNFLLEEQSILLVYQNTSLMVINQAKEKLNKN